MWQNAVARHHYLNQLPSYKKLLYKISGSQICNEVFNDKQCSNLLSLSLIPSAQLSSETCLTHIRSSAAFSAFFRHIYCDCSSLMYLCVCESTLKAIIAVLLTKSLSIHHSQFTHRHPYMLPLIHVKHYVCTINVA